MGNFYISAPIKTLTLSLYLLALIQFAGQLYRHTEPPELNRGAVLLAGQEDAVRLDVPMDDIIVVTILESLQSIGFR